MWAKSSTPKINPVSDKTIVYNAQSKIYHDPSCNAAKRCTKNCIMIKKSEAIKRGARACKTCGG
ncbi:MAG: hypothetical protein A2287_04365 [Candidatus Melainabacteria bacterium RIFOXYA12_FULL_32_12]|nr:MAG: hypothetical protein A2287_04365 [Candidatus Melainabacteria bacterium RIFOXYA12_FULL_32_12]